jgi:ATP-dependent helicase/nuclease subunit A
MTADALDLGGTVDDSDAPHPEGATTDSSRRDARFREVFVIPDKTIRDQRRASDPRASAWVSANAGAGKTKVLTDRVVRLLLAGTPPGRILCLTFTKAAAAEMALRVFDRLGRWVTLDEAALSDELTALEGERPSPEQLRLARRLFARSVETPGGLKIETIHAFCERILHLVPFEANVPARFVVLDENQSNELIAEATALVLGDAATDADPRLREALETISVDAAGDALAAVIGAAVREIACSRRPGGPVAALPTLASELGLEPGETPDVIERAMLEGGLSPTRRRQLAAMLSTGKATDLERARALLAATDAQEPRDRLARYLDVFFTDGGDPRATARIVTKSVDEAIKDELIEEQARLAGLADKLRAARAVERTNALFTLAGAIVAQAERTKARLGALDFHDLIAKTLALLSRDGAQWVLYKLDRGIDHVLVDEAQDTNPDQWRILRLITDEFASGMGARGGVVRTLFAVGDPKQSIYGFQGAAPQEFETSRRHWAERLGAAKLVFEDVRLDLSFRSATAILTAVDATFSVEAHFRGLSYEDKARGTVHVSARPRAPGLVELWPTERPTEDKEPDAWTLPVDEPGQAAPPVAMARRIARAVRAWTTEGDETGRLWSPGDVLILVRKRGPAFEAVIRALKEAGVPVAGADRIDIGEHIAVLDLVAAGRAALLPDDDLTVAAALKSPLVGLTDDDLTRIAALREDAESFAAALRRHAEGGDAAAQRGCAALTQWRDLARGHGPFGFYATLLGPLDGRSKLVARLGSEAGDAIDAFLCFAHAAEHIETPSLTAFLARFESASHQIKRDLDAKRDEVRVMTVHGAKGLEAPIVILTDGCEVSGKHPMKDPPLVPVPLRGGKETVPVWSPGKTQDCAIIAAARDALHAKELEEHNRLLYVAMTRARDRLVIAPYSGRKEAPEEAWCAMIRRGLVATARGLVLSEAPYGPTEVWKEGGFSTDAAPAMSPAAETIEAPPWLTLPVEPEPLPEPSLKPSGAVASRYRGDVRARAEARLRGTLIHALLERLPGLPPEQRDAAARAYVAARAPCLAPLPQDAVARDALRVLHDPALRDLFGPGSRAEVGIAGRVRLAKGGFPVSGQIDRFAVLPDEVLLADFKTGRPPDPGHPTPAAYVAQLALYRMLLRDIYPGRRVRAFLIWTQGPRVQELSDSDLDASLDPIDAA